MWKRLGFCPLDLNGDQKENEPPTQSSLILCLRSPHPCINMMIKERYCGFALTTFTATKRSQIANQFSFEVTAPASMHAERIHGRKEMFLFCLVPELDIIAILLLSKQLLCCLDELHVLWRGRSMVDQLRYTTSSCGAEQRTFCHFYVSQCASYHVIVIAKPTLSILAQACPPVFKCLSVVTLRRVDTSDLMEGLCL